VESKFRESIGFTSQLELGMTKLGAGFVVRGTDHGDELARDYTGVSSVLSYDKQLGTGCLSRLRC